MFSQRVPRFLSDRTRPLQSSVLRHAPRNEVDQTLAKPCDITVSGSWQEYTCDFPALADETDAVLRFFSGTPVGELYLNDLWLEELGDSTQDEINQMIGAWAPGRGNSTITNSFKATYDSTLGIPSPNYNEIPFVHYWYGETIQFFPNAALVWNNTQQQAYIVAQPFWYAYYYSKTVTTDNLGPPTGNPYTHACGTYTCQSQPFQFGRLQFDPRLPDRVTSFVGSAQRTIFLPPELAGTFSGPRLVLANTSTGPKVTMLWATNPNGTIKGVQGTMPASSGRNATIWVNGRQYDNETFVLSGTSVYYPPGQLFTITVTDTGNYRRALLLDQWVAIGGTCTASGCVGD